RVLGVRQKGPPVERVSGLHAVLAEEEPVVRCEQYVRVVQLTGGSERVDELLHGLVHGLQRCQPTAVALGDPRPVGRVESWSALQERGFVAQVALVETGAGGQGFACERALVPWRGPRCGSDPRVL